MVSGDRYKSIERAVKKLLRIRDGEGTKVLEFALLAALLEAGTAVGISAADSLFITKVGADKLPFIYMITPVIMLFYVSVQTFLTGRLGSDRLFDLILGTLAAGGVTVFFIISFSPVLPFQDITGRFIYYFVKLYAGLWVLALYTMLWNFIDSYFDILDAKRLFSFFSGGMALGAMFGGVLVTVSVQFLNVEFLFIVWSVLAVLSYPAVKRLRKRYVTLAEDEEETKEESRALERIKNVTGAARRSPYVILLTFLFLFILVLSTVCEYQYMTIFEEGRSAAEVASLFGKLFFIVNCFNLIVNLLLFNRLVIFFGVRNTALIQPAIYVAVFSFLLLFNGLAAAVFAFFACQGFLVSIDSNNQNFLFNALPAKVKSELRIFIEGIGEPLATAAAGLFLVFASSRMGPESISLTGLAASVFTLCIVLALRPEYVTAMVSNLRSAWLDFSLHPGEKTNVITREELTALEKTALSDDPRKAIPAIAALRPYNLMAALEALLKFLDNALPSDQRECADVFSEILKQEDSDIFRRVLAWVKETHAVLDAQILEELGRYNLLSAEEIEQLLKTTSPDTRAAGAVALWSSWKIDDNLRSISLTHDFMRGTVEEQIAAIRTIGKSAQPRYAHFLVNYMENNSSSIRKQALASMFDLLDEDSDRLIPEFLEVIRRGDKTERLMALNALEKLKNGSSISPLLFMSPMFSPFEKRKVESIILSAGLQSVPILVSILENPYCPHSGKSISARALGKLAMPQLESIAPDLIGKELDNAYSLLSSQWVLSSQREIKPSTGFLARYFGEIRTSLIEFVLEVLTITGRLPDFELMASSLRSDSFKDRANAIETIEQGCSREVFKRLLPLIDSRPINEAIGFYLKSGRKKLPSLTEVLIDGCRSTFQFAGAAAIYTLLTEDPEILHIESDRENSVAKIIKNKLLDPSMDIVSDTVFSLLLRHYNPEHTDSGRLNILEKANIISQTDIFGPCGLFSLELMARKSVEKYLPRGRNLHAEGSSCTDIYIVTEGRISLLNHKQETGQKSTGEVIGTESIFGRNICGAAAVSEGASVLEIPVSAVTETADTLPSFSIGLLAYKTGISYGGKTV